MFVNSLWASFLILQQGTANGDVGWDLVTMWHNMGIPAKIAPVKTGALVDGVLCNTPSATSGMASGDVIISVDGQAVTSPSSLTATMEQFRPSQQITVVWVDPSGRKHTAGMTLTAHPPE